MAVKTQDELIGAHPSDGSIFEVWIQSTDQPASANLKHRILNVDTTKMDEAIAAISDYILIHHIPESKINEIRVKKRILDKYGFTDYLDNIDVLPISHNTIVGNGTEIILAEYLHKSSGLDLLVFRLRYNPNVDQSMKGDDVLLLNKDDLASKIIVGESKFRSTPDRTMLEEVTDTMGDITKAPISLSFVQNILRKEGQNQLAKDVAELQSNLAKGKTPIISVGLFLSNHNTHKNVAAHGASLNPNLVLISLAIGNPKDFIYKCFEAANKKLENIKKCSLVDFPGEYAPEIVKAEIKQIVTKLQALMS